MNEIVPQTAEKRAAGISDSWGQFTQMAMPGLPSQDGWPGAERPLLWPVPDVVLELERQKIRTYAEAAKRWIDLQSQIELALLEAASGRSRRAAGQQASYARNVSLDHVSPGISDIRCCGHAARHAVVCRQFSEWLESYGGPTDDQVAMAETVNQQFREWLECQ